MINYVILLLANIIFIFFLYATVGYTEHHPDGITLAYYACDKSQPLIGNGGFLKIYEIFINCESPNIPYLGVIILNSIMLIYGIYLFHLNIYKKIHFIVLFISLTFYIYSIFFPSKEIILSIAMLAIVATKSAPQRIFLVLIISIIRPIYSLLFFARFFRSIKARLFLFIGFFIVINAISSGLLGEESKNFYDSKASEYEGKAKIIFDSLSIAAPLIRIFWNFLGLPGSILNIYNEFSWHIFAHLGTQLVLIVLFFYFIKILFKKHISKNESLIILFVVLTATFPLPHTRYLYPIIFPLIYLIINKHNR